MRVKQSVIRRISCDLAVDTKSENASSPPNYAHTRFRFVHANGDTLFFCGRSNTPGKYNQFIPYFLKSGSVA